MKYGSLFALLLLFSCNNDSALIRQFDCVATGESFLLNGVGSLVLGEVRDVRCPCFADCAWAGYVAFDLLTTEGDTLHPGSTPPESSVYDQDADAYTDTYPLAGGNLIVAYDNPEGCPGTIDGDRFCLSFRLTP